MKHSDCIAVKTITNTFAIGIISIDHTDDTVDIVALGDNQSEVYTKPLITRYDSSMDEDDCVPVGFEFMGVFQNLDDFIRVNI